MLFKKCSLSPTEGAHVLPEFLTKIADEWSETEEKQKHSVEFQMTKLAVELVLNVD